MNPFARVTCVNRTCRSDRWDRFMAGIPKDWPFGEIERYTAIDCTKVKAPMWWKQGNPAWGCYRSHLNIIEDCLNRDITSVLLLEDDAEWVPDFAARWESFIARVPKDWECLYLGGQHLNVHTNPPVRIAANVFKPFNINRTHAWALQGQGLSKVYAHLMQTVGWDPKDHIDHRLGRLLEHGGVNAYCPGEWLAGQYDDKSDICGETLDRRYFNSAESASPKLPVWVMVLGLHRSGSSCLGGVLARLGVHMGNTFVGCEPDGGYEARDLANMCERALPFPSCTQVVPDDRFRENLRAFIRARNREAVKMGTICGGKYPHMCVFAPLAEQLCGDNLRVVHIERPLEESIASLRRRHPQHPRPEMLDNVQSMLYERKNAFLKSTAAPVINLTYADLVNDTRAQVARLAEFLPIACDEHKQYLACEYVKPTMKHF